MNHQVLSLFTIQTNIFPAVKAIATRMKRNKPNPTFTVCPSPASSKNRRLQHQYPLLGQVLSTMMLAPTFPAHTLLHHQKIARLCLTKAGKHRSNADLQVIRIQSNTTPVTPNTLPIVQPNSEAEERWFLCARKMNAAIQPMMISQQPENNPEKVILIHLTHATTCNNVVLILNSTRAICSILFMA